GVAPQVTLPLQLLELVGHARRRDQADRLADLADARRIAVALDRVSDELQDQALSLGQAGREQVGKRRHDRGHGTYLRLATALAGPASAGWAATGALGRGSLRRGSLRRGSLRRGSLRRGGSARGGRAIRGVVRRGAPALAGAPAGGVVGGPVQPPLSHPPCPAGARLARR